MNPKRIWLTWEKQPRNRSMSREVGAELFELLSNRRGGARYMELVLRTIRVIKSRKPSVVFCQNPSIVLSFLVILLKPFFGYQAVIDEHNAGLYPCEGRFRALNMLARLIVRRADLVIVSNDRLANECMKWNGNAVVVPDPLPYFEENVRNLAQDLGNTGSRLEALRVVFICTWADDEPYLEVIEAAERFDESQIYLRITGDPKRRIQGKDLPSNVYVTGFLPDREYGEEIAKADAVMVLTNRDNCLNCGAYEAVSLEKPGILSDTEVLREYFSGGFCFTKSDADRITESLHALMSGYERLTSEVKELRVKLAQDKDGLARLERMLALS